MFALHKKFLHVACFRITLTPSTTNRKNEMNERTFNDITFNQAIARARAAEAAELALAAKGLGPKPSRDIGEALRQQAQEHLWKVLGA